MNEPLTTTHTAFAGVRRLGSGSLADAAVAAKAALEGGEQASVLVFDDTGRVVDVDLRGSVADVVARFQPDGVAADASPYRESLTPRGRGRPKLGVVAREVTLLPRHWGWL